MSALPPTKNSKPFRGLPLEIFECIIKATVDSPKYRTVEQCRDLCACSLVCTAFVPLCQKILFEELRVEPGPLISNLAETLQQRTSLLQFPRSLLYVIYVTRRPTATPVVDWSTDPSILLHLPRVHSLSIYAGWEHNPGYGLPFHNKPFRASHFLKTYVDAGQLTHLFLDGVHLIPIHDILALSSLTHLHIRHGGISSESYLAPPKLSSLKMLSLEKVVGFSWSLLRRASQLQTLCFSYFVYIGHGTSFYPNIFDVFPLLKNLSIQFEIHECASSTDDYLQYLALTNQILDTVTGLEEITFRLTLSYPDDNHVTRADILQLHLRECVYNSRKTLKRINFYIYISLDIILIEPTIYDILAGIQNDNVLEEIEIIVFKDDEFDPEHNRYYDVFSPSLLLWRKLDELLDPDIVRFPCLNTFRVEIHCKDKAALLQPETTIDKEEVNRFREEVGDAFSRLVSDDGIDFSERVSVHDSHLRFLFPDAYSLDCGVVVT